MSDTCPKCDRPFQVEHRRCGFCENDLGFPNVRYASRAVEVAALIARFRYAQDSARRSQVLPEFERLDALASVSRVVINRNLRQVGHWLYSENRLYQSFFKRRRNGQPYQEDAFNLQRISAENSVSPIFFEELNYAALSLDEKGMSYYGELTVLLREVAICDRTTLFEENPFTFAERHHLVSGKMPPAGFRATWGQRSILVCAKLGPRLKGGESDADLATLVMTPDRSSATCDFVEAHVHGDIRVDCIEKVSGPMPVLEADRVIWRRMKEDLAFYDVELEEAA